MLIMGDFNYPTINYETLALDGACSTEAGNILNMVQDLYLVPNAFEATRIREGQETCILDQILKNEENVIDELKYLPLLGKGDNVFLQFDYLTKLTFDKGADWKLNYWKQVKVLL